MNRTQKLKLNSSVSLLSRITIIFSGLILPRLIISNYGAETHGLVNSINQFLTIITFLDLGVGQVARAAFYGPLARKDNNQISRVVVAAKNYFQKIAYVLIMYVVALIIFYPLLIDTSYSYLGTVFLIIALSISIFGQYYFGIVNELLLSANQQDYVQLGSEIVVVMLNLLVNVVLIYSGASIQMVKLGSGLIFLIRPLFLSYYVNNKFEINYSIEIDEEPLPQKWSGLGHHVANYIQNSTDILILTLFSSLENISVYSVYNMIVSAIKMVIRSLTTGIQSFFGDLYASNKLKLLDSYFDRIEWLTHTIVVFLYGVTVVMINSFVKLYTVGVENITYDAPLFSFIFVLATATYSLRTPYHAMILSAGHFRETQMSSFVEAGLNLIISIILVNKYNLVGVAIGTLTALTFRTLYLVIYLSKNILFRSVKKFIKHIFVDLLSFVVIILLGSLLLDFIIIKTFFEWFIVAIILSIISLIILFIINLIFYKKLIISFMKKLIKK